MHILDVHILVFWYKNCISDKQTQTNDVMFRSFRYNTGKQGGGGEVRPRWYGNNCVSFQSDAFGVELLFSV